jgi:hypothetical protein
MLKYASFHLNLQTTHGTPDSSDVMSLIVALYAIKARTCENLSSWRLIIPVYSSPMVTRRILDILTGGIGLKSLLHSLTVFSYLPYAFPYSWKQLVVFSPLQVCDRNFRVLKECQLIYYRYLEPQACRDRWFIGSGFQHRWFISLSR